MRYIMPVPSSMKFVEVPQPGGAEVLRIGTCPTPKPGKGEVLIKVAAAGLNRGDILQRRGLYPPPPGSSLILGLEAAGTIAAVGEGVSEREIGRKVCCLVTGGGYAEYCAAPLGQ